MLGIGTGRLGYPQRFRSRCGLCRPPRRSDHGQTHSRIAVRRSLASHLPRDDRGSARCRHHRPTAGARCAAWSGPASAARRLHAESPVGLAEALGAGPRATRSPHRGDRRQLRVLPQQRCHPPRAVGVEPGTCHPRRHHVLRSAFQSLTRYPDPSAGSRPGGHRYSSRERSSAADLDRAHSG